MNCSAVLMMFWLNAPHSPRSEVTTTSAMLLTSLRHQQRVRLLVGPQREARQDVAHLLGIGPGLLDRSWAFLSLAAATIFMALVICCVFLTDCIRLRISFRFAMPVPCRYITKCSLKSSSALVTCRSRSVEMILLLLDLFQYVGVLGLEERVELLLVFPERRLRVLVHKPPGRGDR